MDAKTRLFLIILTAVAILLVAIILLIVTGQIDLIYLGSYG